ncbi:sporulation histidine kinase inhibitor Sda [Bacillus alkalicellulosilyticus]|uniref:sporulation histidine kinase inhibitor Sda n=1 Tax=Alkalihalobacterium alkalicellulosilyticum TaxID=1912214 RepID=UPI0009974C77|nr:sporulation histidine kinase inhibitor Sda [Bacillus alkalicellulosilyticus]
MESVRWKLSDELLLEAYQKAINLNLEPDFIKLLSIEIQKRNIYEKMKCSCS